MPGVVLAQKSIPLVVEQSSVCPPVFCALIVPFRAAPLWQKNSMPQGVGSPPARRKPLQDDPAPRCVAAYAFQALRTSMPNLFVLLSRSFLPRQKQLQIAPIGVTIAWYRRRIVATEVDENRTYSSRAKLVYFKSSVIPNTTPAVVALKTTPRLAFLSTYR